MPIDHFEKLAKMMLFTSHDRRLRLHRASSYSRTTAATSTSSAFSSDRATGHYKFLYWGMVICNTIVPLPLFIKNAAAQPAVICSSPRSSSTSACGWSGSSSSSRRWRTSYVPYSCGNYTPSLGRGSASPSGTFGFFFMMFLLFAKFLPVVAVTEKKEEVHCHVVRSDSVGRTFVFHNEHDFLDKLKELVKSGVEPQEHRDSRAAPRPQGRGDPRHEAERCPRFRACAAA